jgi:hypothetical protein
MAIEWFRAIVMLLFHVLSAYLFNDDAISSDCTSNSRMFNAS